MRDIALFGIFLLTALVGFPLMKRLDRFLQDRVKGPEEADQPLEGGETPRSKERG